MASSAEIVRLVAEAIQPIIAELSRTSEERIQRMVGEAQREINRLEVEIQQIRAGQQGQAANADRRDAPHRHMMDQKAFTKIDKFKEGHMKWESLRTQIENLAKMTFPQEGRKALRWARSIGATDLQYNENGNVYTMMPPDGVTHARAHIISQDQAIALSYLLDGEAESILANAGEGSGLDAWRRLQQRFDPRSDARDLVDSQRIVRPPASVQNHGRDSPRVRKVGRCIATDERREQTPYPN